MLMLMKLNVMTPFETCCKAYFYILGSSYVSFCYACKTNQLKFEINHEKERVESVCLCK